MKEYVDRSKAIYKLQRCKFTGENLPGPELSYNDGVDRAIQLLKEMPSSEVRDIKKAKWGHIGGTDWYCTYCGYVITLLGDQTHPMIGTGNRYCNCCGADMEVPKDI